MLTVSFWEWLYCQTEEIQFEKQIECSLSLSSLYFPYIKDDVNDYQMFDCSRDKYFWQVNKHNLQSYRP